ncbi:MAG: hypothetical protein MK116_00390 [Phycisphaerales bacterium]|nr:hypothetical protein [Phycisphaerales bacterium]
MTIAGLILLATLGLTPPLGEVEQRRASGLSPVAATAPDPTNTAWDHPVAARLGQRVFFDPGFSRNGAVSCATCHDPKLAFTDGKPLPMGLDQGFRHTPSLLNVAHHRWFFWDGRADTLWSQALHPFERDEEFGTSRLAALHRVHDDEVLRQEYEQVFGPMPPLDDLDRFPANAGPGPDPTDPRVIGWNAMTDDDRETVNRAFSNLGKAIAAYEHRLISPPSPFDQFVAAMKAGDEEGMNILSPSARRGLVLFVGEAGCRQCHNGALLSDREFHNIGIPTAGEDLPSDAGRWEGIRLLKENPFRANGTYSDAPDSQRGRSTGSVIRNSEHWGAFRTPSLRNLNRTAPYMHHGQFATLADVLGYYNTLEDMVVVDHHQETVLQPLDLSPEQLADLEAFLLSLSSPPIDPALRSAPPRPGTGSPDK